MSPVSAVSEQATSTGSFGIIERCFTGQEHAAALTLWVQPTRLDERTVITSWLTAGGSLQLVIDDGRFAVQLAGDGGRAGQTLLIAPHDLREWTWYFTAVGFDTELHSLLLAWGQAGRTGGPYVVTSKSGAFLRPVDGSALIMGGHMCRENDFRANMDGKVSAPALIRGNPDAIMLMDIMNFGAQIADEASVLGQWAFGPNGYPEQIHDLSGNGRHGRLVNAPSLGVTGPPAVITPDGPDVLATAGQSGYSTVHFHRDDLDDCGWPDTHELTIPGSASSGIYALRCRDEAGTADLPFVVEAEYAAPVLLIVPTFTWQAYANLGREPTAYPGLSHYALHRDGSPVYVSTRLKPMPTIEPGARLEVDSVDSFAGETSDPGPAGIATHLLMADLYVNRWLETTGVPFGVVTDGTLHAHGASALAGCRTVVLSAHPEYWSAPMLDALESFIDGGGSVMYLGGNGLYWVTSVHPSKPHMLEVRRRAGSQTSAAPAGEERHVFDGRLGGTWRSCGRPPDALVNVGFAGFGWDTGVPYRRSVVHHGFEWVFDGIDSDVLGRRGLNMGGAVAIEFDRHCASLAPPGTTVLATARPGQGAFFRSFEDGMGRAPDALVRCDMTIRRTQAGGLVFSLGSIAASGCLTAGDGQNDLARVCANVLLRTLR